MEIFLSAEEIKKAVDFSRRSAATQQPIEFGQSDTAARQTPEIARDNLIGKLAEIAFAKFLRDKHNVPVESDFGVWERGVWDDSDIEFNGWRIDVKATRQPGRWLLVETNKISFRTRENKLPHFFVGAVVGWDRDSDTPTGQVWIKGFASLDEMTHTGNGTMFRAKGDNIPNTIVVLQADNYCRHFDNLNKNWDSFVKQITHLKPFA